MLKIILTLILLFPSFCYGKDIKNTSRNYVQVNYLKNFLDNLINVQADFIQIAPDSEESRGQLYIKKLQKKLLWRYTEPLKIDILIKNNLVTMYDYALEQHSYARIDNIFTQFFLNSDSSLLLAKIYYTNDQPYHIEYKIKIDDSEIQGILSIIILKQSLKLKKLEFIDANQDNTQIIFENFMVKELDDSIFIIRGKKRKTR